jgi:hypothetical protein
LWKAVEVQLDISSRTESVLKASVEFEVFEVGVGMAWLSPDGGRSERFIVIRLYKTLTRP